MKRQMMKRHWFFAVLCALAFAAAVPAVPAYARPKKQSSRSSDERKMRDAAGEVQETFDEKNLEKLAAKCAYPLTFIDRNGASSQIKSRKELSALGSQTVFTKETQDAVGAANTAKIQPDAQGNLQIGTDAGVTMKKVKGRWKITRIQVKGGGASVAGAGDLVQAAEQFQRTFYYRDLETLSGQCTYPIKIYMTDGSIQDISSADKLRALGESRVFTDAMVEEVNQVNAADLKEKDGRVQVGGLSGFWMVKKNGEWKIDLIIQ